MIGQRVEYQTDWGSYGIGVVTQVNENTGTVRVKDDEDGSLWEGPADMVELWEEDNE